MLVVGLIDIISNILVIWKSSDRETRVKCLQHLSEGVSHSIEEKKSQLYFRATRIPECPPGVLIQLHSMTNLLFQVRVVKVVHFNGWQLAKMKKSIPDMSLP